VVDHLSSSRPGFGQPASGAITVPMKGMPAVFVVNVA